jgi:hypothetical protein
LEKQYFHSIQKKFTASLAIKWEKTWKTTYISGFPVIRTIATVPARSAKQGLVHYQRRVSLSWATDNCIPLGG